MKLKIFPFQNILCVNKFASVFVLGVALLLMSGTKVFSQNSAATPAASPAASPVSTPAPQATPAVSAPQGRETSGMANPVVLIVVMGVLALAPFALIMLTSFVKISVVMSILRNALGTQQVPPNQVITGISMILTIFIMAPVIEKMRAEAGDIANTNQIFSERSITEIMNAADRGKEPLREFLKRHAKPNDVGLFTGWARKIAQRNGNNPADIQPDHFRILIPSFVTSQLAEAFIIGFLLFIPFLVIDLVVANILQAMGMFMLSPTIISLPFKLLLFVLVNGWVLLIEALVLSYA